MSSASDRLMKGSLMSQLSSNPTIYITGLPSSVTVQDLADKFGTIGRIKTDKRSGEPKIYVYNDKATNTPKGDGTVTFEDPNAASAAVEWFNGTDFLGSKISVQLAEEKEYVPQNRGGGGGGGGGRPRYDTSRYDDARSSSYPSSSGSRYPEPDEEPRGYDGGQSRANTTGHRGGGPRGNSSGEWDCPNCNNMNFAKRIECFKCKTPKPGFSDAPHQSVQSAAPNSAASTADWICKACSNINWARRNSCNRCNASKPSAVIEKRTGRGGGFNEREDDYDRSAGPSNRSGRDRDYRSSSDRSYRYESSSYDQAPRKPSSHPEADYGYRSHDRDRPAPYSHGSDSYNKSRSSSGYRQDSGSGSGYRQDSGYRRDRSRSPYRY